MPNTTAVPALPIPSAGAAAAASEQPQPGPAPASTAVAAAAGWVPLRAVLLSPCTGMTAAPGAAEPGTPAQPQPLGPADLASWLSYSCLAVPSPASLPSMPVRMPSGMWPAAAPAAAETADQCAPPLPTCDKPDSRQPPSKGEEKDSKQRQPRSRSRSRSSSRGRSSSRYGDHTSSSQDRRKERSRCMAVGCPSVCLAMSLSSCCDAYAFACPAVHVTAGTLIFN